MDLYKLHIQEVIDLREWHRSQKEWDKADKCRDWLDGRNAFIFDTTDGYIVYHIPEIYFDNKPDDITKRQYLELRIKKEQQAEKRFDAWLFSTKSKNIHQ